MRHDHQGAHDLDDESREHLTQPGTANTRASHRAAASGVIAPLVAMALIIAVFVALSARPPAHGETSGATKGKPVLARSPIATLSPTLTHGAGLPEGVEVLTFTLTGPDEGWGTGAVVTNPVDGVPDRGVVLRYTGGVWTQVGATLPGVYLGGLDMISSSEGWVIGGDDAGHSLLLHISNGAWQRQSPPSIDPQGSPDIMAMRTPTEGWLVMANLKGAQTGANTSLLHDVNGVWTPVRNAPYYITDIAPVADGEAWVIGWSADGVSTLVHVQHGVATVELNGPGNSTFSHLRMFAPNDIWIEGAMHAASNADINDVPLNYHYDGVAWSNVNLQVPSNAQHVTIAASDVAWSIVSHQLPPPNSSAYGQIASISSNASGAWQALPLPYTDLQSIEVVSTSRADIWAIGVYMDTTQIPSDNGGQSYSSIGHTVLLRYTLGAWTEWGR